MQIIPAIMPKNINDMRDKMAQVIGACSLVQLDIMDGKFVKSKTFPFNPKDADFIEQILSEEEALPYWQELDVEFDLMVLNAHKNFDMYVSLGPKRIIFHIEAEGNTIEFQEFLEGIDMYTRENIEIGIAINNDTPIENLYPFVPYVSFVQFMGIKNIGYQGEAFDERVLDRIEVFHTKYPDVVISVDGSVNEDTIGMLIEKGATRFVIGSALFDSFDPREKIFEFENML